MQGIKIRNDLFSPSNVKCVSINDSTVSNPEIPPKNFMNSLQNARNTLGCLERSIRKSNRYEQKLLQCKSAHNHSHDVNEWWDSDQSDDKSFKGSNTTSTSHCKSTKSHEDFTESWSTMSIVCLQYQYEELAKRYKSLLEAYNEQSSAVGLRDKRLEQWQERVSATQAQLENAHHALIAVGEKFLSLKQKRNLQTWYEEQLGRLRQVLRSVEDEATRARLRFDARIAYCLETERDSDAALLMYEIRKCNLLFLENMRLKATIENLSPGYLDWNK
ncbi:uncharacterized protein LOC113501171 isoform X2 [Trichoplusia ni]|uniref:Uncharacterized protein LOC113501171 isoform X2 n=1 Tax=Trichoplusia ni TaxID=7111 RepID=A0A7E5WBD2_TRINI|nr:uncharacterized protein LOC113501171 isoform X2 [Trichoplusia ni]